MLPRSRRVSTRLVKEIVTRTRPLHGRFLYMRAMHMDETAGENASLFSVIVPKNIEKSSVGRHRLKRKINEALRSTMLSSPERNVIVIFAKESAKKALREEIAEDGISLLNKIKSEKV